MGEYMKSLKSLENLPTFYNVENGDFIQIRDREPHVEWIILSPPGLQFDHTAINAIAFDYYMKRESTMMLLGSGNGKEYDDMMMYKTITWIRRLSHTPHGTLLLYYGLE